MAIPASTDHRCSCGKTAEAYGLSDRKWYCWDCSMVADDAPGQVYEFPAKKERGDLDGTCCTHCDTIAPVRYDGSLDAAERLGSLGWTLVGPGGDAILCPECWNDSIAGELSR